MGKSKQFKKLRKAALNLPPLYRDVLVVKSGEEILSVNPSAKDKNGNEVDHKSHYKVKAKQRVNHARALKKNFQKHGMSGVVGYAKAVISNYKSSQKNPNEIN